MLFRSKRKSIKAKIIHHLDMTKQLAFAAFIKVHEKDQLFEFLFSCEIKLAVKWQLRAGELTVFHEQDYGVGFVILK